MAVVVSQAAGFGGTPSAVGGVGLPELASEALAGSAGSDVAVLHLDNRSAADRLSRVLRGEGSVVSVTVSEVSAVLGVHCGPGTVGVVVAPRV